MEHDRAPVNRQLQAAGIRLGHDPAVEAGTVVAAHAVQLWWRQRQAEAGDPEAAAEAEQRQVVIRQHLDQRPAQGRQHAALRGPVEGVFWGEVTEGMLNRLRRVSWP